VFSVHLCLDSGLDDKEAENVSLLPVLERGQLGCPDGLGGEGSRLGREDIHDHCDP